MADATRNSASEFHQSCSQKIRNFNCLSSLNKISNTECWTKQSPGFQQQKFYLSHTHAWEMKKLGSGDPTHWAMQGSGPCQPAVPPLWQSSAGPRWANQKITTKRNLGASPNRPGRSEISVVHLSLFRKHRMALEQGRKTMKEHLSVFVTLKLRQII